MTRAGTQTRSGGLSLVELLVALTILAVVLLPVMVGFSQALVATNQSSISGAAASIAREKMEELKLLAYSNYYSGYSEIGNEERQPRPLGNQAGFFEVAVAVTVIRDDATAGLKQAVVSVYRTGSADPVVTLTSYFTPRGV